MASDKSTVIDKLVDKRGYDSIYSSIEEFVGDNPDKLDLLYESNFLEEPDGASLVDIEIIRTANVNTKGDTVSFDVIVSADIEIEETVKRNRETDSVSQWFRLRCEVTVKDSVKSFTVKNVQIYSK